MTPACRVQLAELTIDPRCLEEYRAALTRQIDAALATEPGVIALYAVADPDHPERITVFEIYRDVAAYEAHLRAPHFLAYKSQVEAMVTSLALRQVDPVRLGARTPV